MAAPQREQPGRPRPTKKPSSHHGEGFFVYGPIGLLRRVVFLLVVAQCLRGAHRPGLVPRCLGPDALALPAAGALPASPGLVALVVPESKLSPLHAWIGCGSG